MKAMLYKYALTATRKKKYKVFRNFLPQTSDIGQPSPSDYFHAPKSWKIKLTVQIRTTIVNFKNIYTVGHKNVPLLFLR